MLPSEPRRCTWRATRSVVGPRLPLSTKAARARRSAARMGRTVFRCSQGQVPGLARGNGARICEQQLAQSQIPGFDEDQQPAFNRVRSSNLSSWPKKPVSGGWLQESRHSFRKTSTCACQASDRQADTLRPRALDAIHLSRCRVTSVMRKVERKMLDGTKAGTFFRQIGVKDLKVISA